MPPVVGKVPLDSGTDFLAASELARARHGMMKKKRPQSIAMPPMVDQNVPLTVMPAKALPLLPVCEMAGVEHLREPVRPAVEDRFVARRARRRRWPRRRAP